MMEGGIGNNKIDGSSEKNKKMFFTTSDLMKKINAAMKDNDSSLPSDTGGFELQRKLPDGSYRPAEEGEMAAADFQTKLKQAAEMTAMLTPQQKLRWAKHQRKEGNKIFASGEYKDAMDVYLTCLVAMDQSSKENENNMKAVAEEEECKDPISTAQIEEEIKLPVLLNLALCALKLGMLSKAEKFCNYAMEMDVGKRSVKANFRRGRARMLMGHYVSAELDLARALELNDKATTAATCDLKEVQSEREAILREMEKLSSIVSQAEKNEDTQKKAMIRVFQSNSNNDNGVSSTKTMTADSGLYPEKDVPKKLLLDEEEESEDSHLSCFEWYVRMIGRCAQKLLDIIGEDEKVLQDEEVIPVDQDLVKQFLANAKEKDD